MRARLRARARARVRLPIALASLLGALWLTTGVGVAQTAPPAASPSGWAAGPGGGDPTPMAGFIDTPAASDTVGLSAPFQVSGWVVDTSAQGWAGVDQVQVFLGSMDGGHLLANARVAQPRPDEASVQGNPFYAASGFVADVPVANLAEGPATLSVYAHTPGRGWFVRQVGVTFQRLVYLTDPVLIITAPRLRESVPTSGTYTVTGFAFDRNTAQGTGVDRVQVYLDGDRDRGLFLGEATLGVGGLTPSAFGARFSRAGWQFTIQPTSLHGDFHSLSVYARSSVGGRETLADVSFQTVD